MSENLGDFFKLIAEDKKKKKEEFNEMVGDLGLDTLFLRYCCGEKNLKSRERKKQIR